MSFCFCLDRQIASLDCGTPGHFWSFLVQSPHLLRWHVPPPSVQCKVVSGSLQAGCFLWGDGKDSLLESIHATKMAVRSKRRHCPGENQHGIRPRHGRTEPLNRHFQWVNHWTISEAMASSSRSVELPETGGYSNCPSLIHSKDQDRSSHRFHWSHLIPWSRCRHYAERLVQDPHKVALICIDGPAAMVHENTITKHGSFAKVSHSLQTFSPLKY